MRGSARDAEFSEYVAARRAHLRRTAYLLCRDSHRAEDLVQTVLMKLYVAWPAEGKAVASVLNAVTTKTEVKTILDLQVAESHFVFLSTA
jgi:DNA-directed RNA polymerase specialized sigma24 family protein